jgi:hypothetical protein
VSCEASAWLLPLLLHQQRLQPLLLLLSLQKCVQLNP